MTGTQRKDDDMAQSSEEEWGRDGAEPGQTCSIPKGGSQGRVPGSHPVRLARLSTLGTRYPLCMDTPLSASPPQNRFCVGLAHRGRTSPCLSHAHAALAQVVVEHCNGDYPFPNGKSLEPPDPRRAPCTASRSTVALWINGWTRE